MGTRRKMLLKPLSIFFAIFSAVESSAIARNVQGRCSTGEMQFNCEKRNGERIQIFEVCIDERLSGITCERIVPGSTLVSSEIPPKTIIPRCSCDRVSSFSERMSCLLCGNQAVYASGAESMNPGCAKF